jgi:oligoendopeptidase F
MRELATRAFEKNWIDAESRAGKQGGAFCMPFVGDESRILMNFTPGYSAMSTLAHELGHAYHNHVHFGRTPLQKIDASTLAETASTFCETIVFEAALERATAEESFGILEQLLQDATQIVVDITSRYLFEQSAFSARRAHDVSVEEFCQFMRDAQEQTYGDGLNADLRHEYMWAAKSHYYGPTFYNFPYMFGQLFALGLYSRYREDPATFTAGYDELLSMTGMADAATLASRFGIDIRTREFWEKSLAVLTSNIDKFVALADAHTAS